MCYEQPQGSIILLIVSLAISCLFIMLIAKGKPAVYSRTMLLSVILLLDQIAPCSFSWFITLVVIFHLGEFLSTAIFSPSTLRQSSFLLNHSKGKVPLYRLDYRY